MKLFTAAAPRGSRHRRGVVSLAAVLAAGALTAIPSVAMADIVVPSRATGSSSIAAPAGNERYLEGHVLPGNGVQDYQCNATGTAWTFLHPEATLTAADGTPIIHHFAGPTWQSLDDGSSVQGTTIASRPSPKGAIPWLLLAAKNNTLGPHGGDMLFPTTYIQRVHTTGGVAPATPCTPNVVQAVPYTADYIFYEAENSQN